MYIKPSNLDNIYIKLILLKSGKTRNRKNYGIIWVVNIDTNEIVNAGYLKNIVLINEKLWINCTNTFKYQFDIEDYVVKRSIIDKIDKIIENIVSDYIPMITSIIVKNYPTYQKHMQDLQSVGVTGIYNGILKFNKQKYNDLTYSTHVYNWIRSEIGDYITKLTKNDENNTCYYDNIQSEYDDNNIMNEHEINKLMKKYENNPNILHVIEMILHGFTDFKINSYIRKCKLGNDLDDFINKYVTNEPGAEKLNESYKKYGKK